MSETTTATPTAPEQRTVTADLEDVRTEGRTLHGFAALYGVESRDLGGYRESIAPGAFRDVLAADPDVYLTLNHSPDRVLARTRSGTLRLRDDEQRGLAFEADLGDGPTAQDVRDMVRRGDLSGASFRFQVAPGGDRWEGERRTLTRIGELIDLSLATTPAYDGPAVELRSRPDREAETTTTDTAARQEDTMRTEDRDIQQDDQAEQRDGGGLQVEDRTAAATEPTVEERVLDSLRNVRKGETRSLTTTSADAIAPPELSSFLFDKLRASSVALQSGIVVIPTDRESIQFPKVTADVNPAWYAETDLILPGDPTLVTLTATPKKLAHIVELSNEVIDDSEPSIVNVLNGHLATVLGLKLDRAIFEGTGTGDEPLGLANVAGIQTGPAPSTYDAFIEAVGMLQAVNAPGPYVAVGPPSVFTELALLKNGTLAEQLPAPAQMPTVYASTQVASVYVYSASQVVLVRRQDATIELDRSRLFNQDMSELRGKLRADVLAPNPQAIVELPVVAGS